MSPSLPVKSETLLHFELATDPDPPQASPKTGRQKILALTFVANVPDDVPAVFCDSVSFHFDIGDPPCDDASYLTCVGSGIGTQVRQYERAGDHAPHPSGEWELLDSQPDGTFTFVRPTGVDPKVVEQGYTFEIFDIAVSPVVGTAKVTVTEHSSPDDPTECEHRTATFNVAKFPPRFASVVFETDATAVDPHGVAHLRWEGDDSARYTLSWNGSTPIDVEARSPGGGWATPKLTEDTEFTLTVSYQAEGRTVKRDYYLSIHVRTPRLGLEGDRYRILSGEAVTLSWETDYVSNCILEGGPRPASIDGLTELPVSPTITTEYFLSGTTRSGRSIQSNRFKVEVFPKPEVAKADLVFIKTANTQGRVEVHAADGARRYQQRGFDAVSRFDSAWGPNGTWTITPFPEPALVFIKTRETRMIEVYVGFPPNYRIDVSVRPSEVFRQEDGPNGRWLIAAMGNQNPFSSGALDLVFVKTADTTSGHVEIYWDKIDMANDSRSPGDEGAWTSMYAATKGPQGTWLVADMTGSGVRPPDLVFIQTVSTDSGKVELSYATGASGFRQQGGHWVSGFDTDDADKGTWLLADMDGDGRQDLVFVKTANSASGRVEIYWASRAEDYRNRVGGYTEFDVRDGPNGTWQVVPAGRFPQRAPGWEPRRRGFESG